MKGSVITVFTNHPMSREHYIVRHTLVSKDGDVLGARTSYPKDEKAISTFSISDSYNEVFCYKFL